MALSSRLLKNTRFVVIASEAKFRSLNPAYERNPGAGQSHVSKTVRKEGLLQQKAPRNNKKSLFHQPPCITYPRVQAAVQALCLAISLIACNDIGTGALYSDPEGIDVVVGKSSISVANNSSRTIYFFAIEERAIEFVDWIQGCDTSSAIGTGLTREIPYTKVVSYSKGCNTYVFWWNCPYDHHLRSILVKTL